MTKLTRQLEKPELKELERQTDAWCRRERRRLRMWRGVEITAMSIGALVAGAAVGILAALSSLNIL